MKKKTKIIAAGLLLAFTVSVLTGCEDDREDELEAKVEQLEQQVTDLENKDNGTQSGGQNASTQENGNAGTETDTSGNADFASLSAAVQEMTAKADSAKPSGTAREQREQYYNLKKEMDDIDHQLDLYDDKLESQYRNGELSASEYRSQEKDIDKLEDALGASEDRLEILFGIDD